MPVYVSHGGGGLDRSATEGQLPLPHELKKQGSLTHAAI